MEVGLIAVIILGSLSVACSIVGGFWWLGRSIGRLEGEVKSLSKNQESQYKNQNERFKICQDGLSDCHEDIRSINTRMNSRAK